MNTTIIKLSAVFILLTSLVSCSEDDDNDIQVTEGLSVFENIENNPDATLLYQTVAQVTGLETFGASLTTPIPLGGRRTNILFEGPVTGQISGNLSGTDFATMLPNGNVSINVYGVIETNDGAKIAVRYRGETVPDSQAISNLTETGTLTTNNPNYTYLNDMFIVGVGISDNTTNTLTISLYGFESDPFNGEDPYTEPELPDYANFPFTMDTIEDDPNATLVYEAISQTTGVEGLGANPAEVFSGQVTIPMEGVRMNVDFAGTTTGELAGTLTGTDYITVFPNGNLMVDIQGMIETNDGERVALSVDGLSIPSGIPGQANFFETASFTSNSSSYNFLNDKYIIGVGTSNAVTNVLTLRLYRFDGNPLD